MLQPPHTNKYDVSKRIDKVISDCAVVDSERVAVVVAAAVAAATKKFVEESH